MPERAAPPISVVVIGDAGGDAVERSLRSIAAQTLPAADVVRAADLASGVAAAARPWIAPLVAGDVWSADALAVLDDARGRARAAFVFGGWCARGSLVGPAPRAAADAREVRTSDFARRFARSPGLATSAMLFARSAYDAAGGYDATLLQGGDADLALRMARAGTVVCVRRAVVRIGESRLRAARRAMLLAFADGVLASRIATRPDRYPPGVLTALRRERGPALRAALANEVLARDRNGALALAVASGALDRAAARAAVRGLLRVRKSAPLLALRGRLRGASGARAPGTNGVPAALAAEVRVDAPAERRYAVLTFDDGPNPETTPRLIDVLRAADVRATFFVLGWKARLYPSLCRCLVAAGMEVGHHSMTHAHLAGLDPPMLAVEVGESARVVAETARTAVRSFRPPFGEMDALTPAASPDANVVLWNVDSRDWDEPSAEAVAERAIAGAQAPAVILLHERRPSTIDALPQIIAAYRRAGFSFVTASELGEGLPVEPG